VVYRTHETCVFIDPLLPEPATSFWRWADRLVSERRTLVLTTIQWHRRSREAFVERYGAVASDEAAGLPSGVEPFVVREADETMFWLPEPRALVPGDRILGRADGGLRLCPDSWMCYLPVQMGRAELTHRLRPLLDLPIECVLVAHGEPVLTDGRTAVANALANG
jgi:hypothetical protein